MHKQTYTDRVNMQARSACTLQGKLQKLDAYSATLQPGGVTGVKVKNREQRVK